MTYEYTTTFKPILYDLEEAREAHTPDIEAFLEDQLYSDESMNKMGEHDWELVSVQPVLGVVGSTRTVIGGGPWNTITKGYFFFWKRALIG